MCSHGTNDAVTLRFHSVGMVLYTIYFIGVSVAVGVVLLLSENNECDEPLELWAIFEVLPFVVK